MNSRTVRTLVYNFYAVFAILSFLLASPLYAQDVGNGVSLVSVNDWGTGFSASYSYQIADSDTDGSVVRDWRIDTNYTGDAVQSGAYLSGYPGTVRTGSLAPDGGFAITNEGVGYRPELAVGTNLVFTLQGQGSSHKIDDYDIQFVSLTEAPTNQFSSSLVSVNDWYNPSWGGGFNAIFRCDVLGPDAQIGPVTDLLIEFNYTGNGAPSNGWTQSHDGPIESGFIAPDGGYAISNQGGFQPELMAGDSITFAIQVQGAGFLVSDFDINCSHGGSVENVNQIPVANAGVDRTIELGEMVVLSGSGADADGDSLSYQWSVKSSPLDSVAQLENALSAAPNFVPDVVGSYELSLLVSDGTDSSTPDQMQIIVAEPNQIPIAQHQAVDVNQGAAIDIDLTAVDPEGQPLTFEVVTVPAYGSISGEAPSIVYTADADYVGSDTLQFTVSDGILISALATVSITVTELNEAPIAVDQQLDVDEDQNLELVLQGTDSNGDALTYEIVSLPSNGTLEGTAPTLVYLPTPDFHGEDTFSFRIHDGELDSNLATVLINVVPINDRPVAQPVSVEGVEDTPIDIVLLGTDADGDVLTWTVESLVEKGALTGNGPAFTYLPNKDFNGSDSFVVTVSDGAVLSEPVVVSIAIAPVNDVPVVEDLTISINEGDSVLIPLSASDPDLDSLTFSIVGEPDHGEAILEDHTVVYTPLPGYVGSDSFSFVASDGTADSNLGTVTIEVISTNSAPEITSQPMTNAVVGQDYAYQVAAVDPDSDVLQYSLEAVAPVGMSIDPDSGLITWIPSVPSTSEVSVLVTDDRGGVATQSYTVSAVEIAQAINYQGRDFWMAMSGNLAAPSDLGFNIYISSKVGASGTIDIPTLGINHAFAVDANSVYTYTVEESYRGALEVEKNQKISNKSIHIVTDADVSVYALNQRQFTTDGYLVLPTDALGQNYVVTAFGNANTNPLVRNGSNYTIVATEDNTTVTIDATYDHYRSSGSGQDRYVLARTPFTLELDQGDTFETDLSSFNYRWADTSGTHVLSDKPVAVYGGHECAHVPFGRYAACDHLVEQTLPIDTWGTQYVTAPLASRVNGDLFRIYSAHDDTVVSINDELVANLEAGEHYETMIDGPSTVDSNKPILLAQFSTGANFDRGLRETPEKNADPFMVLVPATQQFLTEYTVTTPSSGISANFVNLIVPQNAQNTILHNDAPLSPGLFEPIPDSEFSYVQLPVDIGVHTFSSEIPFGLYLYGFDEYESYGYLGGMALGSRSVVSRISVSSQDEYALDTLACLDVSAFDVDNRLLASVQIQLNVSGVNNKQQYRLTDRFGQAKYCYESAAIGLDALEFSSGAATASLDVNWVREDEANHAPHITSVPKMRVLAWEGFDYIPAVSEPESDPLTFAALEMPAGMAFDGATGRLSWVSPVAGFHKVAFSVSDGVNDAVVQTFVLRVLDEYPTAPYLDSVPEDLHSYKNELSYIYKGIIRQQSMPYRHREFLDSAPDGFSYISYRSAYFWSPTEEDVGTHTVRVGASNYIGGNSVREFDLQITDSEPPEFLSEPIRVVLYPDEVLEIPLQVSDAEGEPITYGFKSLSFDGSLPPKGVTLDPVSGLLTAATSSENLNSGSQFYISAEDQSGGKSRQRAWVRFSTRPQIGSSPITTLLPETPYEYKVEATDARFNTLSYFLESGPVGMTVGINSGAVLWTPTADQVGEFPVVIRIANNRGGVVYQSFQITVQAQSSQPPILAPVADQTLTAGDSVSLMLSATDPESDPLTFALQSGPAGMTVDSTTGELTWASSGDQVGQYTVRYSVSDGDSTVTDQFSLSVMEDTLSPRVEITSPVQLSTQTSQFDVVASIEDPNLDTWRLLMQRRGNDEPTELAQGTTEEIDAALARVDTSMLINGLYDLIVEATDTFGNTTVDGITVMVDGDLKVGNFSITFNDLSIPMVGIPIEVNRTYDSRRRSEDLDFGYGWTIDYQNVEVTESRTLGRGWEMNQYGELAFGDIPQFCIEAIGKPTVVVRLPDGSLEEFDVVAEDTCKPLPFFETTLGFEAREGTTSELRAVGGNAGRLNEGAGEIAVLGGSALDPSRYELTTKAGYVYRLNQTDGIEIVTDPNGHTLTYSDTGIVHSAGKSIDFVRDIEGRIIEITDPSGNLISYDYTTGGDLGAVIDRGFATTDFTYNGDHGLVDIVDPLGRRVVRNVYDEDGRMIAQEDTEGNRTEFNHDLAGRQSVVTDRLGRTTTLYYDDRGNVTSKVDTLGQIFTYSFDEFDNQLTESNPLGETTSATFDDRYNQLSQTDALGNTVNYAYNTRGQEVTIVDSRGNSFENAYDSVGNLLTVTDPLGNIAGQNFNGQGLVSLRQDAEANRTTFEYDSEGNMTQETDAEGAVSTYTYDSNNNRLSETRARTVQGVVVSETTSFEYDARDQWSRRLMP